MVMLVSIMGIIIDTMQLSSQSIKPYLYKNYEVQKFVYKINDIKGSRVNKHHTKIRPRHWDIRYYDFDVAINKGHNVLTN